MKLIILLFLTLTLSAQTQFGLPGDIPLPADYDGDGIPDLAVWRPSEGNWYIQPSSDPDHPRIVPWGLRGDMPSSNGVELTVFRPATGIWYKMRSPLRAVQKLPDAPQIQVALTIPESCQTAVSPRDAFVLVWVVEPGTFTFEFCDSTSGTYVPLTLWQGLGSPQ